MYTYTYIYIPAPGRTSRRLSRSPRRYMMIGHRSRCSTLANILKKKSVHSTPKVSAYSGKSEGIFWKK